AAIERMRQAQLARAASERIHSRHVAPNDAVELLVLTAPLHARVRASPTTIQAVLKASPIGDGPLEPQFRRVLRPLGPLGRRLRRDGDGPRAAVVVERMNRGQIVAAPPPRAPEAIVTRRRVEVPPLPWWARPDARALLAVLPRYLRLVAIVLVALALVL